MSDYLWDGSGEPDKEIAQLEQLLGQLRHRQEPPAMPPALRPRRALRWPGLAVAATLLVTTTLALSLWWGLRREEQAGADTPATASRAHAVITPAPPAAVNPNESAPSPAAASERGAQDNAPQSIAAAQDNQRPRLNRALPERRRRTRIPPDSISSNVPATLVSANPSPSVTREERIAGEQARTQLLLALQITSERLNFAQRRIQGQPAPVTAPALEPTQRERLR